MKLPDLKPDKITKPVQLMAVWCSAACFCVWAFLSTASDLSTPSWTRATLVLAAVILSPLSLAGILYVLIRYRDHLQSDPYYAKWREKQEKLYAGFKPENQPSESAGTAPASEPTGTEEDDLEKLRTTRYEETQGLFLIHSWRPSTDPGQVADIVIWLHQHGQGPLTRGTVERVEYQLGPKFFRRPIVKANPRNAFRLDISAYGPMLCVARVYIKGQGSPITLERYVDFEEIG